MLNITVTQDTPITVISLDGSLDALTAGALTSCLATHFEAGRKQVVADFSGVGFTSSAGLRSLLIGMKEARRSGGDLRLAGVQASVHKVLVLSGFASILKMFANTTLAVASFDSAGK